MAGMTKILVGGQWKTVGGPGDALSSTDRAKFDGIEDGATANSTDAQLRDRSTHTGTLVLNGNTMADVFVVANGVAAPGTLGDGTVIIELNA